MKKLKKIAYLVMAFIVLSTNCAYAITPDWSSLPGHHDQGVLLVNGEIESTDEVTGIMRGTIMSTATLSITNEEDGTLYISANILLHKKIDKAYQTIFLDKWDEEKETWVQIGYWEFEKSKEEEEDGELKSYHVGFIVSGCELNRYYRARATHLVQLGDDMEGKATRTNGVLLTKK